MHLQIVPSLLTSFHPCLALFIRRILATTLSSPTPLPGRALLYPLI